MPIIPFSKKYNNLFYWITYVCILTSVFYYQPYAICAEFVDKYCVFGRGQISLLVESKVQNGIDKTEDRYELMLCIVCQSDQFYEDEQGALSCTMCGVQSQERFAESFDVDDNQNLIGRGVDGKLRTINLGKRRGRIKKEKPKADVVDFLSAYQFSLQKLGEVIATLIGYAGLLSTIKEIWMLYLNAWIERKDPILEMFSKPKSHSTKLAHNSDLHSRAHTTKHSNETTGDDIDTDEILFPQPTKPLLLGIIYLAIRIEKLQFIPADLVKWCRNGRLPYASLWESLPNDIKNTIPPNKKSVFQPSLFLSKFPSTLNISFHSEILANALHIEYPCLNSPAIAHRIISSLGLPPVVWRQYCNISHIFKQFEVISQADDNPNNTINNNSQMETFTSHSNLNKLLSPTKSPKQSTTSSTSSSFTSGNSRRQQVNKTSIKLKPLPRLNPLTRNYPDHIMAAIIVACKLTRNWTAWALVPRPLRDSHSIDHNYNGSRQSYRGWYDQGNVSLQPPSHPAHHPHTHTQASGQRDIKEDRSPASHRHRRGTAGDPQTLTSSYDPDVVMTQLSEDINEWVPDDDEGEFQASQPLSQPETLSQMLSPRTPRRIHTSQITPSRIPFSTAVSSFSQTQLLAPSSLQRGFSSQGLMSQPMSQSQGTSLFSPQQLQNPSEPFNLQLKYVTDIPSDFRMPVTVSDLEYVPRKYLPVLCDTLRQALGSTLSMDDGPESHNQIVKRCLEFFPGLRWYRPTAVDMSVGIAQTVNSSDNLSFKCKSEVEMGTWRDGLQTKGQLTYSQRSERTSHSPHIKREGEHQSDSLSNTSTSTHASTSTSMLNTAGQNDVLARIKMDPVVFYDSGPIQDSCHPDDRKHLNKLNHFYPHTERVNLGHLRKRIEIEEGDGGTNDDDDDVLYGQSAWYLSYALHMDETGTPHVQYMALLERCAKYMCMNPGLLHKLVEDVDLDIIAIAEGRNPAARHFYSHNPSNNMEEDVQDDDQDDDSDSDNSDEGNEEGNKMTMQGNKGNSRGNNKKKIKNSKKRKRKANNNINNLLPPHSIKTKAYIHKFTKTELRRLPKEVKLMTLYQEIAQERFPNIQLNGLRVLKSSGRGEGVETTEESLLGDVGGVASKKRKKRKQKDPIHRSQVYFEIKKLHRHDHESGLSYFHDKDSYELFKQQYSKRLNGNNKKDNKDGDGLGDGKQDEGIEDLLTEGICDMGNLQQLGNVEADDEEEGQDGDGEDCIYDSEDSNMRRSGDQDDSDSNEGDKSKELRGHVGDSLHNYEDYSDSDDENERVNSNILEGDSNNDSFEVSRSLGIRDDGGNEAEVIDRILTDLFHGDFASYEEV